MLDVNNQVGRANNAVKINYKTPKYMQFPELKEEWDNVQVRSYSDVINEKLQNVYGIKSDIKDERILKNILPAIEDFCKINNDKELFKGLNIGEYYDEDNKNIFECNSNWQTEDFEINFNKNFDWDNIAKFTKNEYDSANCGSNNEKYYIYQALGYYLNFKHSPYDYSLNSITKINEDKEKFSLYSKMSNSKNLSGFNAAFIATKMCKEPTPKILEDIYVENGGNTDLIFPASKPAVPTKIRSFNFETTKEASKYLYEQYGIRALFHNLTYANACCEAVNDMAGACRDKNIFRGLDIIHQNFGENSKDLAYTQTDNFGYSRIVVNSSSKFSNTHAIENSNFDLGWFATNDIKNSVFIHELAHYLDFKGNPEDYRNRHYMAKSGIVPNAEEKKAMSKVSRYATTDTLEFCAEYVEGRMSGQQYPKIVDKIFEDLWNGPKFNYPELTTAKEL